MENGTQKGQLQRKMFVWLSIFVVLVATVMISLASIEINSLIDDAFSQSAMNTARAISALLDLNKLNRYYYTGEKDEYYENVRLNLKKVLEITSLDYAAVVAYEDNKITVIWDVSLDNDKEVADLGYMVPVSGAAASDVQTNVVETGVDSAVEFYNTQKDGQRVSVAVRATDEDFNGPVYLVCLDLSCASARLSFGRFWTFSVLMTMLVLLIGGTITYSIIQRGVIKPIVLMSKAAANIVNTTRNESFNSMSGLKISNDDEIGDLWRTMSKMENDLKQYTEELKTITAEKERIITELDTAKTIQASMLPSIFPPFPDRKEFSIYASTKTAREVGGDFYDFFFVNNNYLVLVVADVSGKGIPAALFMMTAKTLLRYESETTLSPRIIFEKVNRQLYENNKADMFVTAWIGIMNVKTGHVVAANAGHQYPVKRDRDSLFRMMSDKHGFVMAAFDDTVYQEYEFDIDEEGTLVLYTDGVTESINCQMQQFGVNGMLNALNRNPDDGPEGLIKRVNQELAEFAGQEQQYDDITLLVIKRNKME